MQTGTMDRYIYEERKSRMHAWLVGNVEAIEDEQGVAMPVTFDLLDRMAHVDVRGRDLTAEEAWLRGQYVALRRLYHASCIFPYKDADADRVAGSVWPWGWWPILLFLGVVVVGLAILYAISY